jgi:sugar/nucleoside kinase (ribokinase family)
VERAVHAGAVTATRPGAQPAMPSTVDLEASMAGLAGTL